MKSICSILSMVFILVLFLGMAAPCMADEIYKEFEAKDRIVIKTLSGDCEVKKGDSDKITAEVISHVYPRDAFDPVFREHGNTLKLTEYIHGSSNGDSKWILTVPEGTNIDFSSTSGGLTISDLSGDFYGNTASGSYEISKCKAYFDLNTASGDYRIDNCEGEFEINSASGDLRISNVIVTDNSSFNTASGDVRGRGITAKAKCDFGSASGDADVELAESPEADLNVGSASGNAMLDYNGNKMAGFFELTAKRRGGDIKADIDFDNEEEYSKSGQRYIRKTAQIGDDKLYIHVGTASGRAELRR